MTSKLAMELTFEEYCDADLSLIRDYYETTFSHYVPDLAERIFVVRDAHWLVGAVRLRVAILDIPFMKTGTAPAKEKMAQRTQRHAGHWEGYSADTPASAMAIQPSLSSTAFM